MSGFDPDAYLTQSSAAPAFDPDAYLSSTTTDAPEPATKTGRQHAADVADVVLKHPFTSAIGMGENVLSSITGGAGAVADAVTLSEPGTHDWAYRPRTEAGQGFAQAGADEAAALGRGFDKIPAATLTIPGAPPVISTLPGSSIETPAGDSPFGQTLKRYGPEALAATGTVAGAGALAQGVTSRFGAPRDIPPANAPTPPVESGQAALDRAYAKQSMGAASTAPRITGLPVEAQQEIRQTAQKTGGIINPDVLERQNEANEFNIHLTRGQATGDASQLADEFNTRNQNPEFSERRVDTNKKLIAGINGIKDDVAPSAAVDHETNAQTVIDAYKDIYEPIAKDATAKWKAFQDAAGGALPLDPGDFTTQVQTALKKVGKTRYLPAEVADDLSDINSGEPFTVERWDNLKTNLAAAQRAAERSGNGNAGLAIGAVRDAVENYNFPNLDPALKALNDQARAATARKYAMLKADPAMDAAVNDGTPRGKLSPEAKGYMERYFLKGNKADLEQATANLGDNIDAKQAIAGSALNELKKSAGIDMYRDEGNFSQAGYNKRLNELQPRINYLLDSQTADKAFRLGNVARNALQQPTGPAFNNSGTSVASHVAKRIGSTAANVAEAGANAISGKLKLGTGAREEIEKFSERKWVQDSLKPYAGLDYVEKPK